MSVSFRSSAVYVTLRPPISHRPTTLHHRPHPPPSFDSPIFTLRSPSHPRRPTSLAFAPDFGSILGQLPAVPSLRPHTFQPNETTARPARRSRRTSLRWSLAYTRTNRTRSGGRRARIGTGKGVRRGRNEGWNWTAECWTYRVLGWVSCPGTITSLLLPSSSSLCV